MKLTPLFSLVVAIHVLVVMGLFVFPGCQSAPPSKTSSTPAPMGDEKEESTLAYGNVDTEPERKVNTYGRRYPPTRPNWNVASSDKQDVIAGYNAISDNEKPLNPELVEIPPIPEMQTDDLTIVTTETEVPVGVGTYVVKKGDNLSKIAKRQGVKLNDLMAVNGLNKNSILRIGQVLKLPSKSYVSKTTDVVVTNMPERLSGEGTYTVRKGDSLSVIAQRNGVTLNALRHANDIKGDRIYAGQTLVIPEATAVAAHEAPETEGRPANVGEDTYTVKPGDTLGAIAKRYSVTVKELAQRNNIDDPRRLRAGQVLVIPADEIYSAKPKQSTPKAAPVVKTTSTPVAPPPAASPKPVAPVVTTFDEQNIPTVQVVPEKDDFDDIDSIPVVPVQRQE